MRHLKRLAERLDEAARMVESVQDDLEEIQETGNTEPWERIYYMVEGTGEFPWDCLRYDEAWIDNQEDVALAQRDTYRGTKRIHVVTTRPRGDRWAPPMKRWQSFGWNVVPGSIHRQGRG